jgi:hypothetical protein
VGTDRARLGIDFGTAHTVAVLALPGRDPRPLLFDGSPLLPSAVCADPSGRLLIGRDAVHTAAAEPASFEPHPKRCIDDGTVLLGDREVPVTDLIGAVLRRVTAEATRAAGDPPTDVVLTCPAAWGTGRRRTLETAAASAAPTVRLLTEPVAAAHHFARVGDAFTEGTTALVYDFGAGTFDASVVRRTADGFHVLATEGLPDCGGLDIDAAIVTYLGAVLRDRDPAAWARLAAPTATADRRASRQLWDNVRAAKEMLSRATSTLIHVPLLDADVPLGRDQLEELAKPLLDRTVRAVRAALRDAAVDPAGLAAVFLAGGSSRIPAVTTALHRALGIAPTIVDQPELAVAEGAVDGSTVDDGAVRRTGPPAGPSTPAADPSWPAVAPTSVARTRTGRRRGLLAAAAAGAAVAVIAVTATVAAALAADDPPATDPAPNSAAAGQDPSRSAAPSPTPTIRYAAGIDPCLVGGWKLVSIQRTAKIDGVDVQLSGKGQQTAVFRADGTLWNRFDVTVEGKYRGDTWRENYRGTGETRYQAGNGTLLYSDPKATGTWRLDRNGRRNNGGKLTISLEASRYVCTATTLSLVSNSAMRFVRVRPST